MKNLIGNEIISIVFVRAEQNLVDLLTKKFTRDMVCKILLE